MCGSFRAANADTGISATPHRATTRSSIRNDDLDAQLRKDYGADSIRDRNYIRRAYECRYTAAPCQRDEIRHRV
jgi:hypothetical protein